VLVLDAAGQQLLGSFRGAAAGVTALALVGQQVGGFAAGRSQLSAEDDGNSHV
jgi:hypothetical protein